MNKIAIYSLTRDRLDYTKECFWQLKAKAGQPFDHYIIDNGSTDGTVEWLKSNEPQFKKIIYNLKNKGISYSSNQALEAILNSGIKYDLIIKMDNDCFIESENILEAISEVYDGFGQFASKKVLSPKVNGIINQPTRGSNFWQGKFNFGLTAIVGGLFHIVPAEVYELFRYDESLPLAKYQDDTFCKWFKGKGGEVGYIENLSVDHIDGTEGQCAKFPEYFKRKWSEEKL